MTQKKNQKITVNKYNRTMIFKILKGFEVK